MELEFERQCFPCMHRSIRQVKTQEQTQELRVSDGMPDIGTVLGAWGQCVIRGKEWRKGSIGVTGGVMAWVMYLPGDGGQPQSVEAWIPFQEKWELGDTEREGTIHTQCMLKSLDARMVSGRKLILRAGIGILAEAMEPGEACLYEPPELPEDVQLLKETYPVMIPQESGERSFTLDEEIDIPDLERFLYCTVQPEVTEQQVVGDKATFTGTANCHILYENTDSTLSAWDGELEFSQLADLDQAYDKDAVVSVMMELTSLEPEPREGGVRFKCGMVGQYLIWDKKLVETITDAYSPVRSVQVRQQEERIPAALDMTTQTLQPQVVMNISCSKVVDTTLLTDHPTVRRAGDLAEVETAGIAQVLYYDTEGKLRCDTGRWDAQWDLPAESSVQVNANVMHSNCSKVNAGGNQVTVSPQLQLQALSTSRQGMHMVTGMELGEGKAPDPARPSLIVRSRGEMSLWELAKSCGSTVDAIRKANGLQEEPSDNRMLLIPI